MASASQFLAFVRSSYPIIKEENGSIYFNYNLPNGRAQLVGGSGICDKNRVGEWASIESPIGSSHQIDLLDLLQVTRAISFCGGIVALGNLLMLRDTFPIAELQADEFNKPFVAISFFADVLESRYSRKDNF